MSEDVLSDSDSNAYSHGTHPPCPSFLLRYMIVITVGYILRGHSTKIAVCVHHYGPVWPRRDMASKCETRVGLHVEAPSLSE